jgi:hypothetical protein
MKPAHYKQEILYINSGTWNVKLFTRYSHELTTSVFIITEFYCTFCKTMYMEIYVQGF